MSAKDKLIERFKRQPKDFTFDELKTLLGYFGFKTNNKGKTSGSRVEFENLTDSLIAHKPHPSNIIKGYAMKQILDYLKEHKYIK
ncbi:MAG: type II toxin-antitoxin system HicA family toxin [Dysgonamonadaceae bacterium]|jgi:hypothetical protein|nr:type II toxin-antitoxin system HicA family toxin [Dysgonamonadaceae bacterium]